MILPEHRHAFERIRRLGAYQSPFLMLGKQQCRIEDTTPKDFFGVDDYATFDPDGGDIQADLAKWIPSRFFKTVFNLGTIEHIWDIHSAFCRAILPVEVDGYFIQHGPVGGYEGHGIHVTDFGMLKRFFILNGFKIIDAWITTQSGQVVPDVRREGGQQLGWIVAKKIEHVNLSKMVAPQQTYRGGRKVDV